MKRISAMSLTLLLPASARAQEVIPLVTPSAAVLVSGPHFFAALVAGLALAVAFQLVLTNLSVAAGITAAGPIHMKNTPASSRKEAHKEAHKGVVRTVRSFSNLFGIWALITASVSLFFASWLAVELSLTASYLVGAIIGLTVWGFFYVTMMILEATALSSLVGSVMDIARNGFRAAYETTTSMFRKSPEDRAGDAAVKIAESVRKEVFGDMDAHDVRKAIDSYVKDLDLDRFQPRNLRREMAELLNDAEIKAVISHEGPLLDRETITAHLETEKGMSPERAQAAVRGVEEAIGKIREEAGSDKDRTSKVIDAAMRIAGISSEDARASREKVENYLRATGKEQLSPDGIKRDLEKLVTDPRGGVDAMRARLASLDKSTVTAVLEQRPEISHDEAVKIVDTIDQISRELQGKVQDSMRASRETAVGKIRNYLDNLHREEMSYDAIRHDVTLLFHDPRAGADALITRLRSIDRDTIKAIIASRRDISEEDADRIIERIESARDDVIGRAEKMRDEVEHRVKEAEREALHQAEEVRKTAATAAWWAFGAAVVSGISAALGGILAVSTGL